MRKQFGADHKSCAAQWPPGVWENATERIRESPDSSKSRKLTMKDTQLPMGAPRVWGT